MVDSPEHFFGQQEPGDALIAAVVASFSLLSKRNKAVILLLAAGNLAINVLDIVAISLIGLLAAVSLGGPSSVNLVNESGLNQGEAVALLLALAAILFILKTFAGVLLAKTQFMFLAGVETAFSNQISRHIFEGELSDLKRLSRADIEWAILRSTDIAFSRILGRSLVLIAETGLALLVLGLFLFTDWLSAIFVLAYFGLVLGSLQLFARVKSKVSGSNVAEGSVLVGKAIGDAVTAFREISVLSRVPYFSERIRSAKQRVAEGNATQFYLQAIPRLILELSLILGAVAFSVFQYLKDEGNPDFGVLSVFVVGSLRMMSALLPLQRAFIELRFLAPQAAGAHSMIVDALSTTRRTAWEEPQVRTDSLPRVVQGEDAVSVVIRNLSFEYKDGEAPTPILRNVNLEIGRGESVAIIGPSGAGKSTLIDLVLGLSKPSSGHILFDGVAPKEMRIAAPGRVGFVPQKPSLVSGSLRDNVALGVEPDKVDEGAVEFSLQAAGILEFVNNLPMGIHTLIGGHLDSLSGGQIQRIGLARALYTGPRLLVLDEPTSSLDAETEASIVHTLSNISQSVTTVIVAHRLSTIKHVDRVIILDRGMIIKEGSFDELKEQPEILSRYVS